MMRMFIFLGAIFLVSSINAQLLHEQKIRASYGDEYVNQMQSQSPGLITLLDKYIDHGFDVKEVDAGKYNEMEAISTVPLRSKASGDASIQEFLSDFYGPIFNPLKYNFFPSQEFQVFKLAGTNKIIYILPQEVILAN